MGGGNLIENDKVLLLLGDNDDDLSAKNFISPRVFFEKRLLSIFAQVVIH